MKPTRLRPPVVPLESPPARFHREAFALWVQGTALESIASQMRVRVMQIHRWKRKERWDELARAVAPAVQKEVVEHAAYSVAEIKVQHSNEARSLRQRIMQMLDGFPIKTLVTSDGKPVHVYGHPSPGDIRLLVGAYKEVSDLELERLGEEPVNGRFDLRFPEFASLLEDIWSSRRKEVPVAERRGMTTPSDRVRLGLLEPAREQPRPLVTPP